ncbi:MAG: hypothetical protein HZB41_05740 [Ignavibacteriae bacterium]|nr:hypothetical protein [Ignavibacteriota bacterium]
MENKIPNRELNYKDMQEMLPDYVFGRLTQDDIILFELHLTKYPDLQEEIKQVKDVFGKVEAMELDKKITQKTRNLSIKVNNRLEAKNIKQRRFSFTMRFLVPSLGLAMILLIIFVYNPINNGKEKNNLISNQFQILDANDALSLFDSTLQNEELAALTSNLLVENRQNLTQPMMDESTSSNIWDEFITQHLSSGLTGVETALISIPDQQNYNLLNEMNNMEENDFQNMLEEFSNVNFNI